MKPGFQIVHGVSGSFLVHTRTMHERRALQEALQEWRKVLAKRGFKASLDRHMKAARIEHPHERRLT